MASEWLGLNLIVDKEQLIVSLAGLDYETILNIIMDLEAYIADSVFTDELRARVEEALKEFGEVDDDLYIE